MSRRIYSNKATTDNSEVNGRIRRTVPWPLMGSIWRAPIVQVVICLTCVVTLIQVLVPSLGLDTKFEVIPGCLQHGQLWRPLTANLVHYYGIPHLLFNLFGLILAGPALASIFGEGEFLVIYVCSGYVAWSVHSLLGQVGSGASASLEGVFGALVVYCILHWQDSRRDRVLLLWITLLAAAWFVSGPLLDGHVLFGIGPIFIANDVHLIGFLVGALLGILLNRFTLIKILE